MKKLVVEENGGWDPETRAEYCCELPDALKRIADMIEDGYHAGLDSPEGWDWELHEVEE